MTSRRREEEDTTPGGRTIPPARHFTTLTVRWRGMLRKALRRHGLTIAEYLSLGAAAAGSGDNHTVIAERAGLDAMSVSRAMRSLEERGLVDRDIQADPRNWEVLLEDEGHELLSKADHDVAAALSKLLKTIPKDRLPADLRR